MRRTSRRAITTGSALLALALGAMTLTGCSVSPFADRCGDLDPGDATDLVTTSGDIGQLSSVDFPTPVFLDGGAQRAVVERGDGEELPEYGVADVMVSLYIGETGELAVNTQNGEQLENIRTLLAAGDSLGSISRSLLCAREGDRIVLVTSASETSDDAAEEGSSEGDSEGDSEAESSPALIYIIDVLDTYLGKANGVNQLPQDGMPTVVTAVDGTPGINVPATLPEEPRSSTIKAGGGAEVREGDKILIQFRAWNWFDSPERRPAVAAGTWGDGAIPVEGTVTEESFTIDDQAGSDFGPEVAEALLAAKVGAQLLVVIPTPDSDAAARVFVLDVLGVTEAADDGD